MGDANWVLCDLGKGGRVQVLGHLCPKNWDLANGDWDSAHFEGSSHSQIVNLGVIVAFLRCDVPLVVLFTTWRKSKMLHCNTERDGLRCGIRLGVHL